MDHYLGKGGGGGGGQGEWGWGGVVSIPECPEKSLGIYT